MSLIATTLYRIGAASVRSERHMIVATLAQGLGQILTGADLDPHAIIGPGLYLNHPAGVVVGPGVVAGRDLVLYGGSVLGLREKTGRGSGYPRLGDGVKLYAKATVIGPVEVGDGAFIGAHALLLEDAPAGSRVRAPAVSVVDQGDR